MKKITVGTFNKMKETGERISALTAYDYSTAKAVDEAGIDMILVGDSLSMVVLGYETTHQVSVDEMLVFTKAVARGAKHSLIVADMPFLSYQASLESAVLNAGEFIKAGAGAVKLEGGSDYIVHVVNHLVSSGIPVVAHLGFTPQFLHTLGGYNVQGKDRENIDRILDAALKLQAAGAFALVLEMVPEEAARYITERLEIPTIGIGAGRYCSGQILVVDDLLGKFSDFTPKFARRYANLYDVMKSAFENYKNDIKNNKFPSENEIFSLSKEEAERLNNESYIKN